MRLFEFILVGRGDVYETLKQSIKVWEPLGYVTSM
jgi:hypothetical protein